MLDENPYKAPAEESKLGMHPRIQDQRSSVNDDKEIRYAQLGLRLLGIMFLVEGVGGILGSLVYVMIQSSEMQRAGLEPFPDAYAFGWFAGSAALLVAGIYFVVGGRYVLESVFLPSSSARDIGDADDAIGSSGG